MVSSPIKSTGQVVLVLVLTVGCTKPPTLLQRSPVPSIPDGLTINLFTARPPAAFHFLGGKPVSCPFIPSEWTAKGQPVPHGIKPKRQVSGWIKVPTTNQVAVLTETERWGVWPLDLLAMISGHPIPHNTFYIELYDSSGHFEAEVKCLTGTYLSATICWRPPPTITSWPSPPADKFSLPICAVPAR